MDAAPRRTGTLLVYAGYVGLATTFLVCLSLSRIFESTRGWHCGYPDACTVPVFWTWERTRDVLVLWFGGVRSVLQIRAGRHMRDGFDRKSPLVQYLAVAAIDTLVLAYLGEFPVWTLVLAGGWPLFIYGLTRSSSVRAHVWEPMSLPRAQLL